MASNHEIELSRTGDQLVLAQPDTTLNHVVNFYSPSKTPDQDLDKESVKSALEDVEDLDAESPITYHYLTFQTELPTPVIQTSRPNASLPPESPALKQYQNPFEWRESRKTAILWISCVATSVTAFSAGSYVPAIDQMTAYFGVSEIACLVGITVFTCGFGIAPMLLAPFSEIKYASV